MTETRGQGFRMEALLGRGGARQAETIVTVVFLSALSSSALVEQKYNRLGTKDGGGSSK